MATLKDKLLKAMQGYTGEGFNAHSYLTSDEAHNLYTVVTIAKVRDKRIVNTSLAVMLEGDLIIIEKDINNKPLVDALIQAGVPREQIVLAYAGETVEITQ